MDDDCTSSNMNLRDLGKGSGLRLKPVMLQHFDEPENVVPLIHGPADAWFYRRLVHSRAKLLNAADARNEPDVSLMPQGPLVSRDYF